MPPSALFACWIYRNDKQNHWRLFNNVFNRLPTSTNNSDAANLCLIMGCESGDSSIGSIGSSGLIKWANIHSFGSDTSNTFNGLCLPSTESTGGGNCNVCDTCKIDLTRSIWKFSTPVGEYSLEFLLAETYLSHEQVLWSSLFLVWLMILVRCVN